MTEIRKTLETPTACADCGNPRDLRPLRLLTNPAAKWLCVDTAACVRRTIQTAYWLTRIEIGVAR